jgi:hypothetical protein
LRVELQHSPLIKQGVPLASGRRAKAFQKRTRVPRVQQLKPIIHKGQYTGGSENQSKSFAL